VLATASDYDVTDAVEARFREMLHGVRRGPTFGNGRYARNVLEASVGQHAWRLRDVEAPTVEQLRTLEPDDLVYTAVDDSVDKVIGIDPLVEEVAQQPSRDPVTDKTTDPPAQEATP
jgi:hypothetical protein